MFRDITGAYPENFKALASLEHTSLQVPVLVSMGAGAGGSAKFF